MKFCTFRQKDVEQVGIVSSDNRAVYALKELNTTINKMEELIENYTALKEEILTNRDQLTPIPLDQVELLAPIPHPKHDVLCVGLNYQLHALESAKFAGREYQKPEHPVYFSKRVNQAVGPNGRIPAHANITEKLDYEVELAVIMGKTCSKLAPEEVFDAIFGYTIANDVSARDIQMAYGQYTFGKGLDGFAPMGPWIATKDEFPEPPHLNLKTYVNGELRQDSNTSDLIFDLPYMISELSQGMTLETGDILMTGTPAGVGMGFIPPRFLKAGDEVICEVEGIGQLRNTVG
ncbi:fumarylacetoacetate hydrolase family protein [Enterococcus sp. AZ163]|uniref:fumarylacetoacetate hydrolase family protein n=1 Tax=Enterococcus sp. AZ163 TaxID=2774638 RepID=UPI003D267D61